MSKIVGISLALTTALVAIPTLAISAPANSPAANPTVVYGHDGAVFGQDPDPAIRNMLRRDQVHE